MTKTIAKGATQRNTISWARFFQLLWLRRVIQLYFVLFITKVAVEKALVGEESAVFVPGPESYSPFGGFEGLYKFVTSGGLFIAHTHWSNLVLFGTVVLVALLTKSAFCGWICPFGTLQEWLGSLGKRLGLRRSVPQRIDSILRNFKYVMLVWATVGAAVTGVMVFRDIDPYHALVAAAEVGFASSTVVLLITLAASLFVERPWCKYACPLGALIGLIGHLSLTKVERSENLCKKGCRLCDKSCPMGVEITAAKRVGTAECNNCLTCVEACPWGALDTRVLTLPSISREVT